VSLANPTNRRRSERVMLQIPVTVMAETPDRVHVREETQTLVVNAHGGLMKLKAELHVGQPLLLMNPQTGVREGCRVVRIDQPAAEYFAVAFEFDHPSPKFWPVVFPPADWGVPKKYPGGKTLPCSNPQKAAAQLSCACRVKSGRGNLPTGELS